MPGPLSSPHTSAGSQAWGLVAMVTSALMAVWVCLLIVVPPALAITAPELRGQRALQDLQPDMHGRSLQQAEFLKASLAGYDFSQADLRGAVFNNSDLRGADLREANLGDVVAYATRFDDSDLSGAILRNAMLMQSRFSGARIEGADFTDAVLDLPQQKQLCERASGSNPVTGVLTRDSLACR